MKTLGKRPEKPAKVSKLQAEITECVKELTAQIGEAVLEQMQEKDRIWLNVDSGSIDLVFDGELIKSFKWGSLLMDGVTSEIKCGCVKESPEHFREFSRNLKNVAALIDGALSVEK